MKKKIFIWKIEVKDLSKLGTVTTIDSELFLEEQGAIDFLKKKSNGALSTLTSLKKEQYFDCGDIGFRVTLEEVK